jgi:hypothetical protein
MTNERLEIVTLYIKFSRVWHSANENQKQMANNWGKLAIKRINKLRNHKSNGVASMIIRQINHMRDRTFCI